MQKYAYIIKDKAGKTIQDIIEANSVDELAAQFQDRGYFIVKIEPVSNEISIETIKRKAAKKSEPKSAQRKFAHGPVKLADIVIFSRQLATMLESGVPLLRSLDVIVVQIESRKFHAVLTEVRDDVEQGKSLSQSLAKHPKVFSQFWVSLVEVGEASGTMPLVLEKLAVHMEEESEFRASLIGALIYPVILLFICIAAVVAFAMFVGPRFEEIFASMDIELPQITVIMLALFKAIKTNFFIIAGGCVALWFAFKYAIKTEKGRGLWESFLFSIPNIGKVYKIIIVERFASQMAILVNSGVPILYSLEIVEKLVENQTCAGHVVDIRESVKEGSLLSQPMGETPFFPHMAVQMIKVGEETGELGKMLQHVSRFYKKDVKDFMSRLSTLIEPVMLIVMGAIMGTIVIAMFMPMFDMSTMGG